MPIVHLPDGRVVHFADDTAPEAIEAAVRSMAANTGEGRRSYFDDVARTAAGEVSGFARGLTAPVLHPLDTVAGLAQTVTHPIDTTTAVLRNIKRLSMEGDAGEIGDAVGNVLGGVVGAKALPAAAARAPAGMVRAGEIATRTGAAIDKVTPFGLAEAAFRADPHGLAVAAAPTALKVGGRVLTKAGEALGGRPAAALAPAGDAMAAGYDRYLPNTSAPASAPVSPLAAALSDQLPEAFGADTTAGPRVAGLRRPSAPAPRRPIGAEPMRELAAPSASAEIDQLIRALQNQRSPAAPQQFPAAWQPFLRK
jgi:hypothetical protein